MNQLATNATPMQDLVKLSPPNRKLKIKKKTEDKSMRKERDSFTLARADSLSCMASFGSEACEKPTSEDTIS